MPLAFLTSLLSRRGAPSAPLPASYGRLLEVPGAIDRPLRVVERPLTVLLVVEPGLDGVFRHVEGLVDFLFGEGVRLHLAFSSCRSGAAMHQLAARIHRAGGRVIDLRVSNIPGSGDFRALWRLAALIRATRPDVVHAHSSKAGALARLVGLYLRQPAYLYTPHAYYGLGKPSWARVRLFNQVERVLGRVGRTIAISQDEADFSAQRLRVPRELIRVVHNPVDPARFRPATPEQRRVARERYGIPPDAVVLATIGRMCWQKDPETAYQAVAPVCAAHPELLFLHLGWGKWHKYLLGLARRLGYGQQLRIIDYVDDPRSFYHAIDGVLLSSRYEAGWPLVLLEALACNLPVVTATSIGMSDVNQAPLSHVWTFPPEDTAACTAAVRQWLVARTTPPPCNHRQFALAQLTPERCYGAILKMYRAASADVRVTPEGA